MPQSLSKVILYIVFSTKNREPWLDSEVRPRMHAYLATICRHLDADIVHVGGVADHVHLVTTLLRTVSQAQMIEQIKKASSKWITALDTRYRGFFWQRGYRAFSVSSSKLHGVLQYVATNKITIGLTRFRKNTASCYAAMVLISTSVMSGIENQSRHESRFQRSPICESNSWGDAPGYDDIAPLALNRYRKREAGELSDYSSRWHN